MTSEWNGYELINQQIACTNMMMLLWLLLRHWGRKKVIIKYYYYQKNFFELTYSQFNISLQNFSMLYFSVEWLYYSLHLPRVDKMSLKCQLCQLFSHLRNASLNVAHGWILNDICWSQNSLFHDDVTKWKHFPRNWPFVRGIHRSRWIPHTKASDAELWCFLWSAPE